MATHKFNSCPDASERKAYILSFVEMVAESGCWIWMREPLRSGYGTTRINRVHYSAHRLAYEAFRGEIPTGLTLDHLCRVRCCVNPWHLEAVTEAENIRRGNAGKAQSSRTHCPKGHPYSGDNLRIRKTGARRCNACATEVTTRWKLAKGRGIGAGTSGWQKAKTHCPRGHEYSPDNTRMNNGSRVCITCGKERIKMIRAIKKSQAAISCQPGCTTSA